MMNKVMTGVVMVLCVMAAVAGQAQEKAEPVAVIDKVIGNSDFKELKLGVDAVSNRPGRVWKKIPPELTDKGLWFSTYNVLSPKAIKIKVNKAGILYIAINRRTNEYIEKLLKKKKQWKLVEGDLASSGDTYAVLKCITKHKTIKFNPPEHDHGIIVIAIPAKE